MPGSKSSEFPRGNPWTGKRPGWGPGGERRRTSGNSRMFVVLDTNHYDEQAEPVIVPAIERIPNRSGTGLTPIGSFPPAPATMSWSRGASPPRSGDIALLFAAVARMRRVRRLSGCGKQVDGGQVGG